MSSYLKACFEIKVAHCNEGKLTSDLKSHDISLPNTLKNHESKDYRSDKGFNADDGENKSYIEFKKYTEPHRNDS